MVKKTLCVMIASLSIVTSAYAEGDAITQATVPEVAPVAVQAETIVNSMDFQGEPQKLTLEDAIQLMLKDNIAIKQKELELEQAKVNNITDLENLADRKDLLKDNGSLSKYNRKSPPQLTLTRSELEKEVKEKELNIPFALANAERQLEATKNTLKAGVEESYYNLLQAEDALKIYKESLDIAQDLQAKTQKKYELGLVAKQEVLNSELNCIKAQTSYNGAAITVKNAKMALNTKLGKNIMDNIELTDELKAKDFDPNSVNIAEAVTSALDKRYQIKSLELAYELEKIQFEDVATQYTEIMYPYQKEKLKVDKLQKDVESAKQGLEIEVRSNFLQVLQKQNEIQSGIKAVQVSEQALKLSQVSYEAGMNVETDVEQASLGLEQTKLTLSKAILDYNIALLKFRDSIDVGRISSSTQQTEPSAN